MSTARHGNPNCKTAIAHSNHYFVDKETSIATYQRMVRVANLKDEGGKLCEDCLRGRHACTAEKCPCECNEKDFPWPPVS